MRYPILAADFDGTLAHDGIVAPATVQALERWRDGGRKLVLVTGRELDGLSRIFDHVHLFARVVAENGGVLHCPSTKDETILGPTPPEAFTRALLERRVHPLAIGRVIVATVRPHETTLLHVIRDLGLEMQVIFNKDSVMALPSGVNKATGLSAALAELGLSADQAAGVGDAENDHAFLRLCGYSAAVANALPAVKAEANVVLKGSDGAGVSELIESLLKHD